MSGIFGLIHMDNSPVPVHRSAFLVSIIAA
jgi:hypothetical protein